MGSRCSPAASTALTIFTGLADDRCVAHTLVKSGRIHARHGDRSRAVPDLERAAEIFHRNGSRLDEAYCWELMSEFADARGEVAAARRHRDQARSLWQSVGHVRQRHPARVTAGRDEP